MHLRVVQQCVRLALKCINNSIKVTLRLPPPGNELLKMHLRVVQQCVRRGEAGITDALVVLALAGVV